MEIKDFVKEALLQIVDGVKSANEALKGKGATTKLDGSLKTSGGGKLKIAPFVKIGMGADAKGSASNETQIHRIKFTIPLTLPDSPNE